MQIRRMGTVMKIEFTTEQRVDLFDDWSRCCRVDGIEYSVFVKRGKSVRIPYKPRGQNKGWQWNGVVYSAGKQIWAGRVPGSIGVRGLLLRAMKGNGQ